MISRIIVAVLLLFPQFGLAFNVIDVGAVEKGLKGTGQLEIWHDPENKHSLEDVEQAYLRGEFGPLQSAGSTGLKPGAFWSHFALRNVSNSIQTVDLEYIDHQLISLDAFQKDSNSADGYQQIASLSLSDSFDARPVSHNRFVVEVTLQPQQTKELLVKFSSHQAGFVFPDMRIWAPDVLRKTHAAETGVIAFLFGGIFLMSIFALIGAIATRDKTFLIYSVYAASKITGWCTILGYTHQYLIKENFHQSYMSVTGAMSIFFGILFARTFLQTRKYTRKLDYVLILMMANAVFLVGCALFQLTGLSVLSITIALLLYPMMSIAGLVRWRQGSNDAAVFAVAWSFLVFGLVVQALRDLGVVPHNLINYYWPAFASFVEMLGIMAAMGMKVRRLRLQKDQAEHKYMIQLEQSKTDLEQLVWERTRELEKAKMAAEQEARTDSLTGIYNRRSFFVEAGKRLHYAMRKQQPLSLLMFDIDFFKAINDTHGHAMGDEALRVFSKVIVDSLRDSDVFGRLGGEEFALALTENRQGALQTAQRLQSEIAKIALATPEGPLQFTVSIGIVGLQQESDIEDLLCKADTALYQAKNQGRNQIVEHCDSITPA